MEADTNEQEKPIEPAHINSSTTKKLMANNDNKPLKEVIFLDYKMCSYTFNVKSNFSKFDEIKTSARKKRIDNKPILIRNHLSIDYLN